MTWTSVAFQVDEPVHGPHRLVLEFPAGWWALPLAGPHTDAEIAAYVGGQVRPDMAAGVAADLRHLSHAARSSGAVAIGSGAAVDIDAGQLVTATFMLAPLHCAPPEDARAAAGREVCIAPTASPMGALEMMRADYVVGGVWWLTLRTPALGHAPEMMAVFDAIADRCRSTPVADVAAAFGV